MLHKEEFKAFCALRKKLQENCRKELRFPSEVWDYILESEKYIF
jgi:hypothetical protein